MRRRAGTRDGAALASVTSCFGRTTLGPPMRLPRTVGVGCERHAECTDTDPAQEGMLFTCGTPRVADGTRLRAVLDPRYAAGVGRSWPDPATGCSRL